MAPWEARTEPWEAVAFVVYLVVGGVFVLTVGMSLYLAIQHLRNRWHWSERAIALSVPVVLAASVVGWVFIAPLLAYRWLKDLRGGATGN